ncbi:unnamed protein product [Trichogramma brassicae]|uniref:Uncharacterized protein n=1 Tax=Trichogramma brassicae TaxID=86971 RepID=A0A6H5J5A4_9HYME|nr:unnamed protein product [Trichogramma brassicae]
MNEEQAVQPHEEEAAQPNEEVPAQRNEEEAAEPNEEVSAEPNARIQVRRRHLDWQNRRNMYLNYIGMPVAISCIRTFLNILRTRRNFNSINDRQKSYVIDTHTGLALSYCKEPIPIGKPCQLKSERKSGQVVFPTDPADTRTYWDIWITAPPCAEGLQCKMYKNMPLCLPASIKCIREQASDTLNVVERLEKRGYELDRSDALTIMKLFDRQGFFKMSTDFDQRRGDSWYDDEEFASEAKKIMISSNMSLYEVVRLHPKEASKVLTCSDFVKLSRTIRLSRTFPGRYIEACGWLLCEMMCRGFFRQWALEPFWQLIWGKLPIETCEIIIDKTLSNKDLSASVPRTSTSRRGRTVARTSISRTRRAITCMTINWLLKDVESASL